MMKSSSRPGPITRFSDGWPSVVGSSAVVVSAIASPFLGRSPRPRAWSPTIFVRGHPSGDSGGPAGSAGHSGHVPRPARPPDDLSRHRRDRLHRRAPRARTARGRPPGAGDDPVAGTPAGPPVGRPGRDRAGRRRRRRARSPPPAPGSTSSTTWSTRWAAVRSSRRPTAGRRAVMARAAREAGVGRLVYLGALVPEERGALPAPARRGPRSPRSCWAPGVPTVVLRAAVILGSGSASFEMLRYLTERLPVMVTPALGAQPDPADRRPRRAALPRRLRRPAARRCTGASTSAARTS